MCTRSFVTLSLNNTSHNYNSNPPPSRPNRLQRNAPPPPVSSSTVAFFLVREGHPRRRHDTHNIRGGRENIARRRRRRDRFFSGAQTHFTLLCPRRPFTSVWTYTCACHRRFVSRHGRRKKIYERFENWVSASERKNWLLCHQIDRRPATPSIRYVKVPIAWVQLLQDQVSCY